jgi:YhcH/YjgK/YiaL family protein
MKLKPFLMLLFPILVLSCTQTPTKNPEKWSNKQVSEWFTSGEWKSGWNVTPDVSVNQREFALQFFKNRERWEKAFNFLKNSDLQNMNPGKYALEGDTLYATISEYTTKDEADSRFEAHRKYADIQYVVEGEEQIGITAIESATETVPYDSTKDILFLTAPQNNYKPATPANFFVFFPQDVHRPGVKTGENTKVRKAVVKVLIQ